MASLVGMLDDYYLGLCWDGLSRECFAETDSVGSTAL